MKTAKVTDDNAIALVANEIVMTPARVRQVLEAAVAKGPSSSMISNWLKAKAAAKEKAAREAKIAAASEARAEREAKAAAEAKVAKAAKKK